MKKLITGILALTMSVACFAGVTACSDKNKDPISSSSEDNTAKLEALESAGEYLKELYREEVKAVSRDYTLPNTTSYDGTTFNVTWSVKVTKGAEDSVKVEAGDEETLINVNEATEEEIEYVLTATISDDDDNSVTVDFNCKVNVIVADSVIAPVENTAYNMYIEQKGAYKNLLLTGNMDSQGKFFEMTTDNSKAANVYAENATGGYKFYIKGENDAKSYITLTEYKKEGKDYYSASVSFSAEGNVFYYDAVGCWACELENDTYFLGSYSTYETASASSSYYMTAENIGRNQFPLLIALPGDFVGGEIESELELPAADSELTVAQALEVAGNFEHDTYTKDKYYVTATVKEVYQTTYGNMIVTDGTNELTVYGTYDSTGAKKYGEMTETKPVAGDTVKLYGVLGKYNETLQMKNGWIMSVTAGSGSTGDGGSEDGGDTTVVGDWLAENTAYKFCVEQNSIGVTYYITGDIERTKYLSTTTDPSAAIDVYAEKTTAGYCFYFTKDSVKTYINVSNGALTLATENPTAYLYKEDINAWVTSDNYYIGTYGTYPTLSASATSYISSSNTGVSQFPASFVLASEAKAPTAAEKIAYELAKVSVTESVSGAKDLTLTAKSAVFSDVTISWAIKTDESSLATLDGNTLKIANPAVDATATVIVTVTLTCGNETETKDYTINVAYANPDAVVSSASISFADTTNRTSYSTSEQVWVQNGVTVTNNKGASTSNVGDYSNPARFYKSSNLTIAHAGMTKIVIECDPEKGTSGIVNSISDANASVATSGNTITITFNSAVDTFTVTDLAAQVRVSSITVYY